MTIWYYWEMGSGSWPSLDQRITSPACSWLSSRLAPYNLERSRDPETTRVNATFVIFLMPARPVRTLFGTRYRADRWRGGGRWRQVGRFYVASVARSYLPICDRPRSANGRSLPSVRFLSLGATGVVLTPRIFLYTFFDNLLTMNVETVSSLWIKGKHSVFFAQFI